MNFCAKIVYESNGDFNAKFQTTLIVSYFPFFKIYLRKCAKMANGTNIWILAPKWHFTFLILGAKIKVILIFWFEFIWKIYQNGIWIFAPKIAWKNNVDFSAKKSKINIHHYRSKIAKFTIWIFAQKRMKLQLWFLAQKFK